MLTTVGNGDHWARVMKYGYSLGLLSNRAHSEGILGAKGAAEQLIALTSEN